MCYDSKKAHQKYIERKTRKERYEQRVLEEHQNAVNEAIIFVETLNIEQVDMISWYLCCKNAKRDLAIELLDLHGILKDVNK